MIKRNIGLLERMLRFGLGVLLISWVIASATFGVAQGLACLASFALFWNSIFGRCYLWKWLGINSCASGRKGEHSSCGGSGTRA